MPSPKKRPVHYTLSTHWDREWREPFQGIRYALVALLDRVIAGLEDGRLHGPFQTDGQSILMDDYLEIRPDRRAQVERLTREGKLVVGPWYSMPDEFTVSGEALIRNLLVGRQDARALGGEPSRAGYVPDMFGHNSQMPQIFAGFGIPRRLRLAGSEPGPAEFHLARCGRHGDAVSQIRQCWLRHVRPPGEPRP